MRDPEGGGGKNVPDRGHSKAKGKRERGHAMESKLILLAVQYTSESRDEVLDKK